MRSADSLSSGRATSTPTVSSHATVCNTGSFRATAGSHTPFVHVLSFVKGGLVSVVVAKTPGSLSGRKQELPPLMKNGCVLRLCLFFVLSNIFLELLIRSLYFL